MKGGLVVSLALGLAAACAPGEPLRRAPADGDEATPTVARCEQARASWPSGPLPAGDPCGHPNQCQHGPDERVTCGPNEPLGPRLSAPNFCHLYLRGQLDGPCTMSLTWAGQQLDFLPIATEALLPTSFYCDMREHLECDVVSHRCRPMPTLGESCAILNYCDRGTFCDWDTKACLAARPRGAACDQFGDLVEQPTCVASSRCNLEALTCAPLVPQGGHCFLDTECASGACLNNACTAPGDCPEREGISYYAS